MCPSDKARGALVPKTPLEFCPICNCFYYDITGRKLCPHEKDYPHAEINNSFINKAKSF
jgi:hypothetical protein